MSLTTGNAVEPLYSSIATGTQLATFTTEDNLQKTLKEVALFPSLWSNMMATGRGLRVKAMGRLGTTGTPTFTWSIRFLTSTTWSAAGVGFSTAAITCGSGVTLAPWFLDIEITLRTLGAAGANSTIAVMGELRGGTSLAAGGGVYSMPAANTSFTSASFDCSINQYLFLSAACGTSSGSNLIQLEMLKVYGE